MHQLNLTLSTVSPQYANAIFATGDHMIVI